MRMTTGLARIATLSSIAVWALAFQACDSNNADEDTATDSAVDSNDLVGDTASDADDVPDGIPDPTTEPPVDTHEVTPDTPADVPVEPGSGAVGDACASASDCGGTAPNCMTDIYGMITFPNGYCSGDCLTDADCGDGGTCFDVMGYMQFCMKDCEDNSDCRESEGYSCSEVPYIGGGPFCLPAIDMPEAPTDAPMDVPTDVFPDTGSDIPPE